MSEPLFNEELGKIEEVEIRRGKAVRGKVISISDEAVVVNIGYKYDGLVPIQEFGSRMPEIDQEIPVIIKKIDDRSGIVWLSFKSAEKKEAIQKITEIKEKGETLKGIIKRRIKGGYLVDISTGYFRGILLDELSGTSLTGALKAGDEIEAYIDAIDFKRRRVILDRERLVREKRERETARFLEELKVGEKHKGTVKNVTDFGIFVEVGPIDVLIRKRELSWERLEHPSQAFKEGDEVEFVITSIDKEKGRVQGSIRLARKTRWHLLADKVSVGDVFEGRVKKKTGSGLYVWLMEGLDGLLPQEEFSKYIRDVTSLKEGDPIRVRIKSINPASRLIILTHPTR